MPLETARFKISLERLGKSPIMNEWIYIFLVLVLEAAGKLKSLGKAQKIAENRLNRFSTRISENVGNFFNRLKSQRLFVECCLLIEKTCNF